MLYWKSSSSLRTAIVAIATIIALYVNPASAKADSYATPHYAGIIDFQVNSSNGQVFASGMPAMWLDVNDENGDYILSYSHVSIILEVDGNQVASNTFWDTAGVGYPGDDYPQGDFYFSRDPEDPSYFPFDYEYQLSSGEHSVSLTILYAGPFGSQSGDTYFHQTINVTVP